MKRYSAKRDLNEPKIIEYLKRVGCTVQALSQRGVPDLLVAYGPFNLLMEVKGPTGTLTPDEQSFFKKWGNSQVAVVHSIHEVKEVLKQFMPVRLYQCETCGLFEKKQAFKDDPLSNCPICNLPVRQKYVVPTVLYKGNGWGGKNDVVQS